jgi:hypothetical protein
MEDVPVFFIFLIILLPKSTVDLFLVISDESKTTIFPSGQVAQSS